MRSDSVFLITGGAGGIGTATSERVIAAGHRVASCDLNLDAARVVCERLGEQAKPFELDVRDTSAWSRTLDAVWAEFGGVDVLVNNAGLIYTKWVNDHTDEEIRHMVDVNFMGLVNGCRAVVPRMLEQGRGHVVNLGSLAAYTSLPGQSVYCATKHAVRAFNHGYAMELRNTPVTFTLICPAAVNTPMWQKQIHDDAAVLSFADAVLEPEQVADAIYRAAVKRPRQVMIPAFKGGSLKLFGGFPGFMAMMLAMAEKTGRKKMEQLRRDRAEA